MLKWCCKILVVMALVACSKPDPSEVVGQTAKLYYDYLLQGRYREFVDGMKARYNRMITDGEKGE